MRLFFLIMMILFFIKVTSTKNYYTGTWETFGDAFHTENASGRILVNSIGEARWDHSGDFFLKSMKAKYSGCESNENSINNYSSFTLSLAVECASTDTTNTFNLTTIGTGSPFYMYGYATSIKSLKSSTELDLKCFYEQKCVANRFDSFLRRKAERTVTEDDIFVGSASFDYLEIEEVRFTDTSTEVLLMFNKRDNANNGTLHEPGAEFAYFLRDTKGNRYDLLSQHGWQGSGDKLFGPGVIPADTEYHVLLFEPVNDASQVNNVSLIEGECEESCWNFYDVRLKDQ